MTTIAENEILTRVGAGTPMGDLMRQYWIPALKSSELVADREVLAQHGVRPGRVPGRVTQVRFGAGHPVAVAGQADAAPYAGSVFACLGLNDPAELGTPSAIAK